MAGSLKSFCSLSHLQNSLFVLVVLCIIGLLWLLQDNTKCSQIILSQQIHYLFFELIVDYYDIPPYPFLFNFK
jgi:hypothetical protein